MESPFDLLFDGTAKTLHLFSMRIFPCNLSCFSSKKAFEIRSILASGDHLELIKMIKAIYIHKKALETNKKRLHLSDERFFKDAEQLLYNEFQYVLKLNNKNELFSYILARIEGQP